MYADLTSRESTISVDSPKTPEKSFADNTQNYLSFGEDPELSMALEERISRLENKVTELEYEKTKLREHYEERISRLENKVTELKNEKTELREHYEERISRLENEKAELTEHFEEKIKERDDTIRVLRRIVKADNLDHLFELLESQDLNTVINNVNNFTSAKDMYRYLLDADEKKGPELLKALPAVLEENDKEGELQKELIKGFLSMPWPVGSEVKHVKATGRVTGTSNQFLSTNSFRVSDTNANAIRSLNMPTAEFDSFVQKSGLSIIPVINLFTDSSSYEGELTELKVSDIQGERMKQICDFINSGSTDAEKLRFEKEVPLHKLNSKTDKQRGKLSPDGVITLPKKKIVTIVEFKSNFGFDLDSLDSVQTLPAQMHGAEKQLVSYMMAGSSSYGFLIDGMVLIMVKILVDKFNEDPQKYKDSNTLPLEYKISSIRNPPKHIIDFILEARKNCNKKIKKLPDYCKKQHNTRYQSKRRKPNAQ